MMGFAHVVCCSACPSTSVHNNDTDSPQRTCRMPLDVLRVDTEDRQHRFAVCVASYGYMGDLMKDSEKLRWMGPARYNIQGAITLFRGKAYKARVSWLPAPLPSVPHPFLCCCLPAAFACTVNRVNQQLSFRQQTSRMYEHQCLWSTSVHDTVRLSSLA